ncbi:hypothetical protein JAAARDRAFT_81812 [Jaapia argillacea MUCL 33604]|uniref:Uncharacterized protein n=1 Tax=Jaapia argillacea MUCL 33604 TaxID=933084 RepID=A0A067P9R7_9AGAM|nr:hypothetical protein JAAARDRAFT_81812 [Jaapia argillacea MUCL 33604]
MADDLGENMAQDTRRQDAISNSSAPNIAHELARRELKDLHTALEDLLGNKTDSPHTAMEWLKTKMEQLQADAIRAQNETDSLEAILGVSQPSISTLEEMVLHMASNGAVLRTPLAPTSTPRSSCTLNFPSSVSLSPAMSTNASIGSHSSSVVSANCFARHRPHALPLPTTSNLANTSGTSLAPPITITTLGLLSVSTSGPVLPPNTALDAGPSSKIIQPKRVHLTNEDALPAQKNLPANLDDGHPSVDSDRQLTAEDIVDAFSRGEEVDAS